MVMLFEFLRWWYGPGWLDAGQKAVGLVVGTQKAFSAGVLLRTLFSPWKQIVTLPGRSLNDKLKASLDNLISRVVGFFARALALLFGLVLTALAALFGLIATTAWPVLPLFLVYSIYRSVSG
ncbi:hypothetical protein H0X09_01730 [Candidatus Saccharibacteria bacterium]|nr:hypothetical protein [Candidatus Saccharibacteria bacterium]